MRQGDRDRGGQCSEREASVYTAIEGRVAGQIDGGHVGQKLYIVGGKL